MNRISKIIIPEVYSEGLSYYEQLMYLVKRVNELIDYSNNTISENIVKSFDNWIKSQYINSSYDESNKTIFLKCEREV